MLKIYISLIFIIISYTTVLSQYVKNWEKKYGSSSNDRGNCIYATSDGNLLIAGTETGEKNTDFSIFKTTNNGNIIWKKRFGGESYEECRSVIETSEKNIVVVGSTNSKGKGQKDWYILYLNQNGNLIWEKNLGDVNNDEAYSVIESKDKNIVVAGFGCSHNSLYPDAWITKLDKKGNIIWHKCFGGHKGDEILSLIEAENGNFFTVGSTSSIGLGEDDVWVMKLNSEGKRIWEKTFGGIEHDRGFSITQTSDGNIAIAGKTASKGAGASDLWIFKIDKNGNKIWGKTFGREFSDQLYSIKELSNGNLAVAGSSMVKLGQYDIQIIVLNTDGDLIWENIFGENGWEEAYSICEDKNKNLNITGYTQSNTNGGKDIYTIQFSPLLVAQNFDLFPVDSYLPKTSKKENNNTLVVIFGIEKNKYAQSAIFAQKDAKLFKKYATDLLNVPEENIYYAENENATLAEFNKVFSKNGWLNRRMATQKKKVIVYYAGHGVPDIQGKEPYLIPYDTDPQYASATGYSMKKLIKSLEELNATNSTVFIDACFSGLSRNETQLLASGDRLIMPKMPKIKSSKVIVFSASDTDQVSTTLKDKKHGLFTYYLLKGLQGFAKGKDNTLTLSELFQFVRKNVSKEAGKMNKRQIPTSWGIEEDRTLIKY